MGRGIWVVGVGAASGTILALGTAQILSGVLYGVTPFDPVVWGAAVLLLASVGTIAHVVPASRAMRLNLTQALRVD